MQTIKIQSKQREELVEITDEVSKFIPDAGEGICVLFTQHTTCGLTINENADPDVKHDFLLFLKNTIPQFYEGFRHFEHNSDAHLKSSLVGSGVTFLLKTANFYLVDGREFICANSTARGKEKLW